MDGDSSSVTIQPDEPIVHFVLESTNTDATTTPPPTTAAAITCTVATLKNKYYDTAKQAAKAYDQEAIKLRRPFAKLNYPKRAPVGYTPIQQPLISRNTVLT